MTSVGIIGSGNTGANTAFFTAERAVANVVLHDIRKGAAIGKSLDMMEAAPVRKYRTGIRGTGSLEEVLACDIVVIAAGAVGKPGAKREDLLEENAGILKGIGSSLPGDAGEKIFIVVSEPVDLLTALFTDMTGIDRFRVLSERNQTEDFVERFPLLKPLDMSDAVCRADYCRAIEGNVLIYHDAHHISSTYMRTMTPELGR